MAESTTATIGMVIGQGMTTDLPLFNLATTFRRYGALPVLISGAVPDNGGLAAGIPTRFALQRDHLLGQWVRYFTY